MRNNNVIDSIWKLRSWEPDGWYRYIWFLCHKITFTHHSLKVFPFLESWVKEEEEEEEEKEKEEDQLSHVFSEKNSIIQGDNWEQPVINWIFNKMTYIIY